MNLPCKFNYKDKVALRERSGEFLTCDIGEDVIRDKTPRTIDGTCKVLGVPCKATMRADGTIEQVAFDANEVILDEGLTMSYIENQCRIDSLTKAKFVFPQDFEHVRFDDTRSMDATVREKFINDAGSFLVPSFAVQPRDLLLGPGSWAPSTPRPIVNLVEELTPGPGQAQASQNPAFEKVLTPYARKTMNVMRCIFVKTLVSERTQHEFAYTKALIDNGISKYDIVKYLSFDEMHKAYTSNGNIGLDMLVTALLPKAWMHIGKDMTSMVSFLNLRTLEKKMCLI